MPIDFNGSWFVGQCRDPQCGEIQLVRNGTNTPQMWREWCNACRKYSIDWGWIRVTNALVTDGNLPPKG